MATAERKDPVLTYNFVVKLVDSSSLLGVLSFGLGLSPVAGFSECAGLESTLEMEEYKEGGLNSHVRRFPTRNTWSNIRLKRGVALSDDLWDWYFSFVEGRGKRRDGLIILHDDIHQPVMTWRWTRGLPAKWTGPAMNAQQSQAAVEEFEVAHEGLEVV